MKQLRSSPSASKIKLVAFDTSTVEIAECATEFGLHPAEIAAIDDSAGDLPMLKYAGNCRNNAIQGCGLQRR
jgi:hypothetical protein